MEQLINSFLNQDFSTCLNFIIKSLYEAKVIDGAVFFNKNNEAQIIVGRNRIKGNSLNEIEGISKSSIKKAINSGHEIFGDDLFIKKGSDSAIFYKISSVYVCPLYLRNSIGKEYMEGVLYLDRIGERRKFSASERMWFTLLGTICQQHIQKISVDEFLSNPENGWIGSSEFSLKIKEEIKRLSFVSPILILGETGVGKGLLAELIHRTSGRKGGFVIVNLPALPENLFEAELFGSRKGAYTDAFERKGLVGEADGGTLFFDEISEIPLYLQGKLLRFIDTGFYKRLGEDRERRADCKIICASNKDLYSEVKNGLFRKDLYFRISAYVINIPPLRERKEDIKEIAKFYFIMNGLLFKEKALERLTMYDYPGNVRELLNILNKIKYIERKGGEIKPKEIEALIHQRISGWDKSSSLVEKITRGEFSWKQLKKLFLRRELSRDEMRKIIINSLHKTDNRTYRALCSLLKISSQDYRKFMAFLHRHGII